MLVLSRRCYESLLINDTIEIKILEISGDKVKIGIEAPRNCLIIRKELRQTVENNREAANVVATRELFTFLASIPPEAEKKKNPSK